MTSLRQFRAEDLLYTSLANLDPLTENYDLFFYNQYLAVWPELFTVAEDLDGNVIGYSESLSSRASKPPFPINVLFLIRQVSIQPSFNLCSMMIAFIFSFNGDETR